MFIGEIMRLFGMFPIFGIFGMIIEIMWDVQRRKIGILKYIMERTML